jgi:hypothetical protein
VDDAADGSDPPAAGRRPPARGRPAGRGDLALRAALGDDAVEQALERGRQMDDDDAVAVALAAFDNQGLDTV